MSLYLPHDLRAFEDDKIVNMFGDLDYYGYGLYWRVLELLYNCEDHTKTTNYKALARVLNCKADILEQLICNYGLFVFSDDCSKFWSDRVLQQCDKLDKGKKDAAENGRKGAQKRWGGNSEPYRGAIGYPIGGLSKNDREPIGSDSNLNNNLNLNLNAAAQHNARAREGAAAAQGAVDFLDLDKDTYAQATVDLANEIAQRFGNAEASPDQLRRTQKLLQEIHIKGQDTLQVVRDGLAMLDESEAIKSGKIKFGIMQFLEPGLFQKLLHGDYKDVYADKTKPKRRHAGADFDGMTYRD